MDDEKKRDLVRILDRYDAKQKAIAEREAERQAAKRSFGERFDEWRVKVATPCLEAIAKLVEERGHLCRVEGNRETPSAVTGDRTSAHVTMTITPKPLVGTPDARASEWLPSLGFSPDMKNSLVVVRMKNGPKTGSRNDIRNERIDDLSVEVIEARALELVDAALAD